MNSLAIPLDNVPIIKKRMDSFLKSVDFDLIKTGNLEHIQINEFLIKNDVTLIITTDSISKKRSF